MGNKSSLQRKGARHVFKPIQLSIVTPVLDSHRMVKRLMMHYQKMNLPDDIEIIFIDDNSDPPLKSVVDEKRLNNFYIYPTGDTRIWTIACARNLGIKIAQGKYIFNTDIDHILPYEAVMAGYKFRGDKLEFSREWGVLDNKGNIRQDKHILLKYGLPEREYKKRGVRRYYHVGTHVIKKKIVEDIDGYPVRACTYGTHPTREDRIFYHRYRRYVEAGNAKPAIRNKKPVVYCFPGTHEDPFNLFHKLDRKTGRGYALQKTQTS